MVEDFVKTSFSGKFFGESEVGEVIAKPLCRVKKLPEFKYKNWKGGLDEYYTDEGMKWMI